MWAQRDKMPSIHSINKYRLSFFILLVIPLSGLSIDIYIPSLPAISDYFNVKNTMSQLTISLYMLGLGVMQLFGGGISDSFGRRKPFILAMLVYIMVTLLIPLSPDIHYLLFLRLIQGMAIAVVLVPMRSVILDLFEGEGDELKKMTNYMTIAWSIGPIIAPAIGGYLQHYFGWAANFYFLAIYSGVIFLILLFYLPETSSHRYSFHAGDLLKRYLSFLLNPRYTLGMLMGALIYSFIILFSVVGPFIIQTELHYSAIQFGHIALWMGVAFCLGAITNRFLIQVELSLKAKICFWVMLIVTTVMLLISFFKPLSITNLVLSVAAIIWLGGVLFPNYFIRSVSLFPETTGSANALFGAGLFLIPSLSSGVGALLKSNTELPLAVAYTSLALLCLIIYYIDLFYDKRSPLKKV